MEDIIFGFFGLIIRWIFVYKCNSKKWKAVHKNNPQDEEQKDILAGLSIIPICIFIGIILYFLQPSNP
jgi:hypothetical protein